MYATVLTANSLQGTYKIRFPDRTIASVAASDIEVLAVVVGGRSSCREALKAATGDMGCTKDGFQICD